MFDFVPRIEKVILDWALIVKAILRSEIISNPQFFVLLAFQKFSLLCIRSFVMFLGDFFVMVL